MLRDILILEKNNLLQFVRYGSPLHTNLRKHWLNPVLILRKRFFREMFQIDTAILTYFKEFWDKLLNRQLCYSVSHSEASRTEIIIWIRKVIYSAFSGNWTLVMSLFSLSCLLSIHIAIISTDTLNSFQASIVTLTKIRCYFYDQMYKLPLHK